MTESLDEGSRVKISPSVYARAFGEEVVLLEFGRGEYFGLDAVGAELREEAFGDFVGTVELRDLLAHDDDHLVAGEFFGEGVADGFAVGELGHRAAES